MHVRRASQRSISLGGYQETRSCDALLCRITHIDQHPETCIDDFWETNFEKQGDLDWEVEQALVPTLHPMDATFNITKPWSRIHDANAVEATPRSALVTFSIPADDLPWFLSRKLMIPQRMCDAYRSLRPARPRECTMSGSALGEHQLHVSGRARRRKQSPHVLNVLVPHKAV